MTTEVVKGVSFARVCTVGGAAVRVVTTTTPPERFCDTAVFQATPTNVGNIYIGGSDVTSSNGFMLEPGDAINLSQFMDKKRGATLDLYNFWVVSDTNNDSIRVLRSTPVLVGD